MNKKNAYFTGTQNSIWCNNMLRLFNLIFYLTTFYIFYFSLIYFSLVAGFLTNNVYEILTKTL